MRTSIMTLVSGAAVVLGIAACGSSSPSADTSPVRTGTGTATQTLSTPSVASATGTGTTASTTSTGSATTTASQTGTLTTVSVTTPDSGGAGLATGTDTTAATAGAACASKDLTAAAVSPNSAPGTTVLGFTLTNSGSATCHTTGWPGIQLLSASGQSLPTDSIRTTSDALGSTPQQELSVAPGQQVSFRLSFNSSNGTAGDTGCDDVGAVAIIAPDDTVQMKATLPGGQSVEDCGTVKVSALQSGSSGTGQ